MQVSRQTLAGMCRSHGVNELAERALSVTDAELDRIGELADCYFVRAIEISGPIRPGWATKRHS